MADKPVTREEKYLAYLTGDYTGEIPKPITRKEKYLYELCLKGIGGEISPEEIKNAVNEYLKKNPVKPGATTEQAQQIEQNKTNIASLKEETGSLKEDLSNKITKFYASSQGETHITDSDNGKIMDMKVFGKSSQDGTPSPENPVEIKSVVNPTIKVVGKNLLNATLQTTTHNGVTCANNGDGTYTLNGTSTVDTNFYIYGAYNTVNKLPLDSQKTYVVKKSGNSKIQFHVGEPDIYTTVASLEDGQIKNQTTISFFICRILSGAILNNFTIYPQVEEGSASTDFQPYREQTAALPYTLNAIPVESGGNVTIDGQQYIADYVDVERGKVVRNVENVTFNGAENENWELWNTDKEKIWSFIFVNSLKTFTNESVSKCNRFEFNADESIDKTFWLCSPSGMPSLQIKNRIIGKDITAFKSWLSNNPINVIYPLRIPIEEELTAEHAQALKELATYYPVTNISIGSEQLDGYTVFNYPISIANGWNYVKKQLNDNRDYIYDMDIQSAEAYVNSEYAVVLTELEV